MQPGHAVTADPCVDSILRQDHPQVSVSSRVAATVWSQVCSSRGALAHIVDFSIPNKEIPLNCSTTMLSEKGKRED